MKTPSVIIVQVVFSLLFAMQKGDGILANETMKAIRKAEAAADQTVNDAKKEADRILDEAQKYVTDSQEQTRKAAAAALDGVRSQAAAQGDRESARAQSESDNEAEAMKLLASQKKDEAVQLVIDQILG